jgi:hypothetical protein
VRNRPLRLELRKRSSRQSIADITSQSPIHVPLLHTAFRPDHGCPSLRIRATESVLATFVEATREPTCTLLVVRDRAVYPKWPFHGSLDRRHAAKRSLPRNEVPSLQKKINARV